MKNTNGDLPAMPCGVLQDGHNCGEYPLNSGLTKREQFAMAAMQGLLVNAERNSLSFDTVHTQAVKCADNLLEELERTK